MVEPSFVEPPLTHSFLGKSSSRCLNVATDAHGFHSPEEWGSESDTDEDLCNDTDEDACNDTLSDHFTSTCDFTEATDGTPTIEEVSSSDDNSDQATIVGEQDARNDDEDVLEDDGGWGTSDDEFPDPEYTPVDKAPGKKGTQETKLQIVEFLRMWAERDLDHITSEDRDRLFIKHARRWGMSAAAIAKTGIVKEGRKDAVGITYRIQKLKQAGKDMTPRTAQFAWQQHRKKESHMTTEDFETAELINAMMNGKFVQEIVDMEIITTCKNTPRAIRHRWDTYIRRGLTLPRIRRKREHQSE